MIEIYICYNIKYIYEASAKIFQPNIDTGITAVQSIYNTSVVGYNSQLLNTMSEITKIENRGVIKFRTREDLSHRDISTAGWSIWGKCTVLFRCKGMVKANSDGTGILGRERVGIHFIIHLSKF